MTFAVIDDGTKALTWRWDGDAERDRFRPEKALCVFLFLASHDPLLVRPENHLFKKILIHFYLPTAIGHRENSPGLAAETQDARARVAYL